MASPVVRAAVPSPRAAIVGIGQIGSCKHFGISESEVACQAITAALEDAGLKPQAVDGLGLGVRADRGQSSGAVRTDSSAPTCRRSV
jgi:hypothetical protein